MSSCLIYLKASYNLNLKEPIDDNLAFKLDCLERMGKQLISIIVSSGLIRSQDCPSNRDISLALKTLQPLLINKLILKDRKELYRIFGIYCYQHLPLFKDESMLELQLLSNFFKIIESAKSPKPEANTVNYGKINNNDTKTQTQPKRQTKEQMQRELDNVSNKIKQLQEKQKVQELTKNPPVLQSKKNTKDQDLDNFDYEQTEQEKDKRNRQLCDGHFLNVAKYLQELSSPQGELTYIWQHLKWKGFETYYEPVVNKYNQWICTAKIMFPAPNVGEQLRYKEQDLKKTQMSKNKRKARQLACMDLLKTLYLSYPQVWLIYKHLKEQKKLVIPPLEGPKDEDQINLIRNTKDYPINKEKVQQLFSHSKVNIRRKMEGISAKAQLNTLLQQLSGRVTSPKIEKKMVEGNKWAVPVKIEYKTYEDIQNNHPPKIYERTIVCRNTKIAEEQGYMQAMIQMYEQNPDLFEKIKSIKLAKNIKDPEKKLPLLRNAKQFA